MSACLRKLEMVKAFSYYTNKLHLMGNIWGWCCSQDVELHYQVCVCRSAPPTQRTSERCSVLPSMTGLYWREAPSNGQRFTEVRCLLTARRPYSHAWIHAFQYLPALNTGEATVLLYLPMMPSESPAGDLIHMDLLLRCLFNTMK